MTYTALLEVDTRNFTISTFANVQVDDQSGFRCRYKIVQDFLLDDDGKVVLDVPVSGSSINLKRDNDFHLEISGEKERSAEIVRGFWSDRKG